MNRIGESYEARLDALAADLRSLPALAVALSGGVDSSVLAHAAGVALGRRALAVTAVSPSVPGEEVAIAAEVAAKAGIEHVRVATRELEDPRYAANDGRRCYFCKSELFAAMEGIARARGIGAIAYGAIVDDLADFRPGAQAAAEFRVLAPLVAAGFGKEDVRRYAREAGLPNSNRPASACLASRIPYGTMVTEEALARVGALERRVRALGYEIVRVRHHGELARVEVAADRIEPAALRDREAILAAARECGYARVALDLRGYRQGAMNEVPGRPRPDDAGLPDGIVTERIPQVLLLRAAAERFPGIVERRAEWAERGRPFAAIDLAPAAEAGSAV